MCIPLYIAIYMDILDEKRTAELAEKLKTNSLSELEFSELQQLIAGSHKSQQLDRLMGKHWQEIGNEKVDVDDKRVDEIYKKILFKLNNDKKDNVLKIGINKWYQGFQKLAAILIVPIIIASVFYNMYSSDRNSSESWVVINSPEGARTEFYLPDGSHGWLNGGSKIKYNPSFKKSRKVELSGEAYFDIAKQNGASFIVGTPEMNIKVLGTKFNVATYPGEELTQVVLAEGKIEACGTTKSFNKILAPGDKLELQLDKNLLQIKGVDPQAYTSWKDGFLMLDGEALSQDARRLERWYNVDIEIVDDVLKNYKFKATFKDETLEEVIRLLALSTPIDYEILPRKMDENGVYMKKKIILKLKQ